MTGRARIGQLPEEIVRLVRAAGLNSFQAESQLNAAQRANATVDEQNRLFLIFDRARRVEKGEIYSAAEAQVELAIANARGAAPDVIALYSSRLASVTRPLAPPPLPGSPAPQGRDEGAARAPGAVEGTKPAPGGKPTPAAEGASTPATKGSLLTGLALVGAPFALAYAFVRSRR